MMNVFSNEKITVSEERYNELIRAEFALAVVRRVLSKAKHRSEQIGLVGMVTLDEKEIDVLLTLTGKGGEEA